MIDETLQDQAALHALGMLQGEEATAFQAALAGNEELQTMVREIAAAAASITHALPSAKAPPEMLPRLLAQIRAERTPAPSGDSIANWMPWALAASIALAATVGFFAGAKITAVNSDTRMAALKSQNENANVERERLTAMIGSLKDERTALEKRVADLRRQDWLSQVKIATLKVQATTYAKAYAKVAAYVVWDVTGQQGVMRFANLPPLAADKDYQMWIIDPRYAAPVSAGIITTGNDEELEVKFTPAREIAVADKFAVSVEQKGGSPTPLGQIVLMSN